MAIKPKVGRYPDDFELWRGDTPQLTIINPEDFPRKKILDGMNLTTSPLPFGNCDPEEAKERIELMRFLADNPDIAKLAVELSAAPSQPHAEKEFCDFYDPQRNHNPFWEQLHALLQALATKGIDSLPSRLQVLHQTLVSFLELETDEKQMAQIIGELLASVAVIEGLVTADVEIYSGLRDGKRLLQARILEAEPQQLHGHRTFSWSLSNARQRPIPKWVQGRYNPLRWFPGLLVRLWIEFKNDWEKKLAYQAMDISESEQVMDDLKAGLTEYLNSRPDILAVLPSRCTVSVYFAYGRRSTKVDDTGMTIYIYDIAGHDEAEEYTFASFFQFTRFDGYTSPRKQKIEAARTTMAKAIQKHHQQCTNGAIRLAILKVDPDFFQNTMSIPSPATDAEHRWQCLENLYNGPDLKEIYQALKEFRGWLGHHLYSLSAMNLALTNIQNRARELGAPLCFPEIVSGQNVIEFNDLYPIHLGTALDRKNAVPINGLPAINGDMIGLTGTHGGGKTVTEHTIISNVFLALSGLPVLGQSFRLNGKTHLGVVFIEGVSGQSVCQLLVRKMNRVFQGIQGVPDQKILLVLDELGSATQENDGMILALRVLQALHEREISVIFSTQILPVAEQAQTMFGAQCFRLNHRHRLQPGIGGGELNTVIEAEGLDRYLSIK